MVIRPAPGNDFAGSCEWLNRRFALIMIRRPGGTGRNLVHSFAPRRFSPLSVLLAALCLAGCSPALETDQARLCRMALPALMPENARIAVEAQRPDPDGRGLTVAFFAETPGEDPEPHAASCRFREPGRPRESRDLVSLTLDGEALSRARLYFLVRYWLATPEGRAADPAPLGDLSGTPELPRNIAYA